MICIKIFVDAVEIVVDGLREIKLIAYNDIDYPVSRSFAGGVTDVEGENYLTFVCWIGKKQVHVYCDDSDYKNVKYFTVK